MSHCGGFLLGSPPKCSHGRGEDLEGWKLLWQKQHDLSNVSASQLMVLFVATQASFAWLCRQRENYCRSTDRCHSLKSGLHEPKALVPVGRVSALELLSETWAGGGRAVRARPGGGPRPEGWSSVPALLTLVQCGRTLSSSFLPPPILGQANESMLTKHSSDAAVGVLLSRAPRFAIIVKA